jgi:hypothetical protein
MSYDVGAFERVKVDPKQGAEAAKQRCIAWGYENAEAFGGESRTCAYFSSSLNTCSTWTITVQYQCTGTIPTAK